MNESSKNENSTIHIKVTVNKNGDSYQATYDPKIIDVNDPGTTLHFKLVTPTPDDVVISSVSISPKDQDQLSAPVISKNGKEMELTDQNTARQTFSLSFAYRDKHSDVIQLSQAPLEIEYPQVVNNPPGLGEPMAAMASDDFPVNNPPG